MFQDATGHKRRAARRAAILLFVMIVPAVCVPLISVAAKMAQESLVLVTSRGEHKLTVEMAVSSDESSLGLMYRTELAEDRGMLFPADTPRHMSMWMKNTYIPLDMVFIKADGIVHRIEAMTEPHSLREIDSGVPVLAVLEIKGGLAARIGLVAGDRVRHRIFDKAR